MLVTLGDGIGLLDDLLSLGEDELDVAGVGHVGVDLAWSVFGKHVIWVVVNIHDRGHGMSVVAAWGPG